MTLVISNPLPLTRVDFATRRLKNLGVIETSFVDSLLCIAHKTRKRRREVSSRRHHLFEKSRSTRSHHPEDGRYCQSIFDIKSKKDSAHPRHKIWNPTRSEKMTLTTTVAGSPRAGKTMKLSAASPPMDMKLRFNVTTKEMLEDEGCSQWKGMKPATASSPVVFGEEGSENFDRESDSRGIGFATHSTCS